MLLFVLPVLPVLEDDIDRFISGGVRCGAEGDDPGESSAPAFRNDDAFIALTRPLLILRDMRIWA